MTTCTHFGTPAGELVELCCGGTERRTPMHRCNHPQRPEEFCVDRATPSGKQTVDLGGPRRLVSVAGCIGCLYHSSGASPPPATGSSDSIKTTDDARTHIGPPQGGRDKTWLHSDATKHAMRLLLDEAAAKDYGSMPETMTGRGIVISGGNAKYFPLAFAVIYLLRRHLRCTLPIELWHLSPIEMSHEMRLAAESLGDVTVRDALAIDPKPRLLSGWESKPYSMLHSRFAEVLYLDADNLPARDPSYLFDDPHYQKHGGMFWPDLPNGKEWIPQETWDITGLPIWNRGGPAFESGQVLIDKRQCWRELNVTVHLNSYSDCWFEYVYGDKDTFKLAWHRCNKTYAMPRASAWKWPAIQQHDLQGNVAFYHACQGKPLIELGKSIDGAPEFVSTALREAAIELQRLWTGATLAASREQVEACAAAHTVDLQIGADTVLTRCLRRFPIYVDARDTSLSPHLRRSGYWEPDLTLALMRLLQPGWKCVNVGANYGYFALLMAAWTQRHVLALEPHPRTFELLKRTVHANGLPVHPVNAAASSHGDGATLWNPKTFLGGASLLDNAREGIDDEGHPARTVRLDDICQRADLILIDAEGHEPHILDGARRLISQRTRFILEYDQARGYPYGWLGWLSQTWPLRRVTQAGWFESVTAEQVQATGGLQMLYLADDLVELPLAVPQISRPLKEPPKAVTLHQEVRRQKAVRRMERQRTRG